MGKRGEPVSLLKFGLVGCGRVAEIVHLKLLARWPGVELVALAEPDPARREAVRSRAPAVRAVADYAELLAMPEVDAVVICLPTSVHASAAVAAMQHGKHVYLEKPLATTLSDGQRVIEAWRRADVVGTIGFNYRLNRHYQAA